MTTVTATQVVSKTRYASLVLAFTAGLGLLFVSGFAQATVLHDAAHDQRHAMSFPCH